MRFSLSATLPFFASTIALLPAQGQQNQSPVVMPSGNYVLQSRDTTAKVSVEGLPFALKGNGSFVITTADGTFNGKLTQDKNKGVLSYTDQGCAETGSYTVQRERGGYVFDVKADPCEGRKEILTRWLFKPKK